MIYSGKAFCLGEHIDTDAIIPARFLVTADPVELGKKCMSGLDPEWVNKITPGDAIIVAGKNFGCGSSREHAPVAIIGAGIPVVIAHSFARIFYRNSFNMGLIPIEIGDDVKFFSEGDSLSIDTVKGVITNNSNGKEVTFPAFPSAMQSLLDAKGLANAVKQRISGK